MLDMCRHGSKRSMGLGHAAIGPEPVNALVAATWCRIILLDSMLVSSMRNVATSLRMVSTRTV